MSKQFKDFIKSVKEQLEFCATCNQDPCVCGGNHIQEVSSDLAKKARDAAFAKGKDDQGHRFVKKAYDRGQKESDAMSKKMAEETELSEATVETKKYSWGTMKTVHHGHDFSVPLHPEHHQAIAKLKDQQEHKFKDETGRHWTAKRDGDKVHLHSANNGPKTTVKHSDLKEEQKAPVAPVPDRKYIKGTPEYKAYMATKKTRVGHPTNEHVEQIAERDEVQSADYKLTASGKKRAAQHIVFHNQDDLEPRNKKEKEEKKMEESKLLTFSEKMNLAKADMADVIKDFQKSDAPQFAGKSKEKRREMAIAAKMQAEELKGSQHKLDVDKDNKIEAEDLAKLRAQKEKENSMKYGKEVKEEVEQIDELDKSTLASYAKKATHDSRINQKIAKDFEAQSNKVRKPNMKRAADSLRKHYQAKAFKREDGVGKAIDRLAKEEIEHIEETTPNKQQVKQAIGIARDKRYAGGNMTGAVNAMDKLNKGLAQHPAVKKELQKQNEEIEQIDEISKKTLGSYVSKASVDMANRTADATHKKTLAGADYAHNISRGMDAKTADKHLKSDYDDAKPDVKKAVKRMHGINKAVNRLTKEDAGFDEDGNLISNKISYKDFLTKIEEAMWPGTPEYKAKYDQTRKSGQETRTQHGTQKGTGSGVVHTRDYDKAEKEDQPEQQKRGRGRPAGSKSGARN